MGSGVGAIINNLRGQVTAGVNPVTHQRTLNARDLIAQQMGGAPAVGRAPPPAHIPSPPPVMAPPLQAPPPTQPQPGYGDVHAIMDYVQGRRAGPAQPPLPTPNVPSPSVPRAWMGK